MSYGIVPNPAFAGKTPRILVAQCHDRTPFLSFVCSTCGSGGHLHESQIEGAPVDAILAVRCHSCQSIDDLLVSEARQAFADMRTEGWYA